MSDVSGFLTGFSNSLNQYLGTAQQNQRTQQNEVFKNQLDEQSKIKEQAANQEAELAKGKALEDYKASLGDDLTPEMGEKWLPKFGGQMVTTYNADRQAKGLPPLKIKDAHSMFKDLADQSNPDNSATNKEQEKLQQTYTALKTKVLSNRSGGFGLQDSKVNQAIDLRNAINQYYDPKTDTYNIPPSMHEEIALGTARLLSPSGQVAENLVEKLKQGTAREKLANAAIFMGVADPSKIGGPTQDVARMFVDTIDRQGQIAEQLRNHYAEGLKGLADPRLDPKRKAQVDAADLTNSFSKELMNAPDYQKHKQAAEANHPVGKVMVINAQGQKGYIPAAQLEGALKSGYKQVGE